MLTCNHVYKVIDVKDIVYFEARNGKVVVNYISRIFDGGSIQCRMENFAFPASIKSLENQLTGMGFLRPHRAFLVASSFVARVEPEFVEVASPLPVRVPLGRVFASEFLNRLGMESLVV